MFRPPPLLIGTKLKREAQLNLFGLKCVQLLFCDYVFLDLQILIVSIVGVRLFTITKIFLASRRTPPCPWLPLPAHTGL